MKTKIYKWLPVTVILAVLLSTGGATYLPALAFPDASPGQLAQPIGLPSDIARFTAALEAQGFTVQNGAVVQFNFIPLCCAGDQGPTVKETKTEPVRTVWQ